MAILTSLLLIVEVLSAFLLIVVILAQKSKDQGLGMAFGSGMGESLFGSRAGNVLTRMTITLAAVFMLTTIVLGILFAKGKGGASSGSVMDGAGAEAPLAPMAAPAAPLSAPVADLPALPEDAPAAAPSAPMALQMGDEGQLAPVEAPAADAAPAAEPAAEESAPAPQE